MDRKIDWQVKKSESVKLGRFETVLETLDLKNGDEGYFSFVRFAKTGVCILPIISPGNILMIEQYRRPFEDWLVELPAGTVDEGEQPEETVKRELLEETGYAVNKLLPCGFFYPSPGSTNERIALFAASCSLRFEPEREPTEYINNKIITKEEIKTLLNENMIRHAAAIILLQKYLLGDLDSLNK